MKKRITIILLGMITGSVVLAQNEQFGLREQYPDTLVLETESKKEILFLLNRMGDRKEYVSNELWSSMLSVMETALLRSEFEEGVKITYCKKEEGEENSVKIDVEELGQRKNTLIIKKDEVQEMRWNRLVFQVVLNDLFIHFHIDEIEELSEFKELDIESVWQEIRNNYENEGRNNTYKGGGIVKYGKASISSIETNNKPKDKLSIAFLGIGLGYYRDRFVPDLGSKLTFVMHNRLGEEWMNFGVLYTRQFFYTSREESGFELDQNGWVTGFWKVYMKEDFWDEFGLGIGTLVHREGDFFKGFTYKLSMYSKVGNSGFTFSPELILTNDFKEVFPAMRIGLTF